MRHQTGSRSRPARLDPYLPLYLATWKQYPKLPASRLYEMCRQRGYRGGPHHFRHRVAAQTSPAHRRSVPSAQDASRRAGPVDWGHLVIGAQSGPI